MPGRALETGQEACNKIGSSVRARVEHVLGTMENGMSGGFLRTIGYARAQVGVGLMNLTYNLMRIEVLTRHNAKNFYTLLLCWAEFSYNPGLFKVLRHFFMMQLNGKPVRKVFNTCAATATASKRGCSMPL